MSVQAAEETTAIPADVGECELKSRLESMPNLGPIQVSRRLTDAAAGTYEWTVAFTADARMSTTCALPALTVVSGSLSPAGATLGAAADLVTTVLASVDPTPHLRRCGAVRIGADAFTVHDTAVPFNQHDLPLAHPDDCTAPITYPRNFLAAAPAYARRTTVSLSPWDSEDLVPAALNNLS